MKFVFALVLLIQAQVLSQTDTFRTAHHNHQKGIALSGYDPVSYFKVGKAEEGKNTVKTNYKGLVYQFVSEEHKQIFLSDPEKYEPQYGGWCAFAMGDYGEKVEVDPETFKITNGKLYLFYNAYFNNTLKSWEKNENVLREKADKNWSKITQ